MSDIVLTSSVRENLLSLQRTASLLSRTQDRLATGKKVNSALDNPNAFFTSEHLSNRAKDLSNLLDDVGQAVQTIKAAGNGVDAIINLVESARALTSQALQTQNQLDRKQYAENYNTLLKQIEDIARDSSYKGKNLLGGIGNDLIVYFNSDNTSKLTISAVDYTDTTLTTGLDLQRLETGIDGAASFTLAGGTGTATLLDGGGETLKPASLLTDNAGFTIGDVIEFRDGADAVQGTGLTVTATTTVQDLVDFVDGFSGADASFDSTTGTLNITASSSFDLYNNTAAAAIIADVTATLFSATTDTLVTSGEYRSGDVLTLTDGNGYQLGTLEVDVTTTVQDMLDFLNRYNGVSATFNTGTGNVTIGSQVDVTLTSTNDNFAAVDFVTPGAGVAVDATDSGLATDTAITAVADKLKAALNTIRDQASAFGTHLTVVENRQNFTMAFINTLEVGADMLVLADVNEEGANMLALQTRQQLSSTALSFAAEADQSVLRLFS